MNILTHRVYGFRLIDVIGLGVLIVLILSVYLGKTIAGRERAEIASVERKIAAENERVALLEAEVAHLERPDRIESLATGFRGLAPVKTGHETTPDRLAEALKSSGTEKTGVSP